MALGNTFFTDMDGNIGNAIVNLTEQNCGLLFDISGQPEFWTKGQGKDVAEQLKDTVVELNSLADAEKLGIVPFVEEADGEEADVSKNLLAGIPYYHIKQFFGMGGEPKRLFVSFADCSRDWQAVIDLQRASGGIISQIGVWTEQCIWKNNDPTAQTYSIAIVGDLQSVAEQMANEYFSPASILLCGNSAKVSGTNGKEDKVVFSKIPDCVIGARYVSVLLSQAMDPTVAAMQASLASTTPVGTVGLALGILSKAKVCDSIGWTRMYDLVNYAPAVEMGFGDSTITNGKITLATAYSALTGPQLDALDDKGYVFMRVFEGYEGHVFFNDDKTCSNGDYCTISRNRVINKSRRLVRTALLPYVNEKLKVDPANGNLSAAQITIYTNTISDTLKPMETAEEISALGTITIPAAQNILRTKKLMLQYTLVPMGCSKEIHVTEGLVVSR